MQKKNQSNNADDVRNRGVGGVGCCSRRCELRRLAQDWGRDTLVCSRCVQAGGRTCFRGGRGGLDDNNNNLAKEE